MNSKWLSTAGKDEDFLDEAILQGLARDGGLYVPAVFPRYSIKEFYSDRCLVDFSMRLLAPWFAHSKISVDAAFASKVFSIPMPLKHLANKSYILELFHGQTLSFKDFGACFFAECLERLVSDEKIKVLVATSGDTGSAVTAALHGKPGIEVLVLFPMGKISPRQQAQITCWGDNIQAIAVKGTFDQCQHLIKQACARKQKSRVTTANSINIARLLPQIIFYAYASIQMAKYYNEPVNFIVPSGNLGNVTACYWAKHIGFPIGQILIATNANHVLTDFLSSAVYRPEPVISTLANAMDVGDPSNLERLIHLFPDFLEFKKQMNVKSVSDAMIKKAILDAYKHYKCVICPHTATAYHRLKEVNTDKPWVVVATAHPAKFDELIEPLLHIKIPVPEFLADLLAKEQHFTVIEPVYEALQQVLDK